MQFEERMSRIFCSWVGRWALPGQGPTRREDGELGDWALAVRPAACREIVREPIARAPSCDVPRPNETDVVRIKFLRGAQGWAFGAAAGNSRHCPPPSCFAAALSRFSPTRGTGTARHRPRRRAGYPRPNPRRRRRPLSVDLGAQPLRRRDDGGCGDGRRPLPAGV